MIFKRRMLFIILCYCFSCSTKATTLPTLLKKVHVRVEHSKVHFIFDANHPIHYHSFQLSRPDRLVIDIAHGQVTKSLYIFLTKLAQGPIRRVRIAHRSNDNLRMVFDLKYPSNSALLALEPSHHKPYRLELSFLIKSSFALRKKIQKSLRDIVIVIDPGHGGKDPGAIGPGGTYEKNIVLSIAKKLQMMINRQPGFHAILTRYRDVYISLRDRLTIARRYRADMFIAIHADAYNDPSARGVSVYALSDRGATSEAARWLAKRENQSEFMGGVNLSGRGPVLKSVLINLSQTAVIRASLVAGTHIIYFLNQVAYLHYHHMEQAAFVVLKSPDIASLLVETGFLSNYYEERRLQNAAYQYQLAVAMMKGICYYFKHYPPRNSQLAYWRHS